MIRFTGKKLSKEDQKILVDAAKFTLNKFVNKSTQKSIKVNVRLDDNYQRGWQGECGYMGNVNGIRKFDVVVSTNKINNNTKDPFKRLREPIKTIIHEMIHVKQYANNQLFDYVNGSSKFEGKVYKNSKTYLEYWDLPWEVEAYGRTEGVYEQFVHAYYLNRKSRKT